MPAITIAEKMLYTTIKLVAFKDGIPISTGTGFMFAFAQEGDHIVPCIVTNKHVVKGADVIRVRLHFGKDSKPSGECITCDFDVSRGIPFWHPDPNIDLCAFDCAEVNRRAELHGKTMFLYYLDMSIVPEHDEWEYFDALEEVTMIGCPNGLSDETNNLPISRRGITATSLTKNYNGKPEFMVDMACFPGSSGSPILIYDKNGFFDRKQNLYRMGEQRVKLVGILYSGPFIASNGRIILSHVPRVEVTSMMHLGNAIKSSELYVLDQLIRERIANLITPAASNVAEGN